MGEPHLHARTSFLLLILFLSVALSAIGCGPAAVSPISASIPATVSTTNANTPQNGLKDINETQLSYQAMGTGQPIVFLHGSGGSHRYFLPFMQPLADDHHLLFYDQRGTGMSSSKIDLKAISIDQFVEDLEALRVAFGFEKISLIGHSWGAIIALFYAFKYQAYLDKLILVDPVPVANSFLVEQNQTLQQRFQRLSPEEQQTFTSVCAGSSAKPSVEARKECLHIDATLRFFDPAKAFTMDNTVDKNTAKNRATIQSLLMTSFTRRQAEIDPQLKTLRVPTLIVHGDFDPIPIGSSEYIQQRIATSQLVFIKQSGHFPFVEQPEQFLAALRVFLRA
jgi:proline iminopeptidase